jgi:NAD(P)-dependent dehydrogenase (short-subunit alcohol dehydrogenase family)
MTQNLYNDLQGKTALITGGLGYLGRALCEEFAAQGTNLILVDKVEEDKKLTSKLREMGIQTTYFQVDFESEENRQSMIQNLLDTKRIINILINNAAFVGTSEVPGWAVPFKHQSIATWRRAIEVNLTTPFQLVQGLEPLLIKSDNPSIINVTSIYASIAPDWSLYEGTKLGNPAAYSASKGGLLQLTRWLASTLGPKVRVNAVSPGGVFRNQDPIFIERYEQKTPLKRMATEQDVVSAILFLASSASAYITGEEIKVDGGWGIN